MRRPAHVLIVLLALVGFVRAESPGDWSVFAVREEIAPRSWTEPDGPGGMRLGLAGRGDDAVDGRWVREVPATAGASYAFRAEYRARGVETPKRSVLARVVWLDGAGPGRKATEYPVTAGPPGEDGWTRLAGSYRAPEGTIAARLELHLRWTARGEVLWRDVDLSAAAPPASRRVRLAAVHHEPRGSKSTAENLEAFGALVQKAADQEADIVALPEGITVVGNGLSYEQAAEPVPGPTTALLGHLARRHRLWIVAGLYERAGTRVYNTAVLLDRAGRLAGRYRKMSLPDEEIEGGLTPGADTPVFDTDFGRVGMMICWDSSYPEVARALASRGAEVILMPIWGGQETLVRARAMENQVYVVASGYDFRTGIFDRRGERIADARKDPEVVVVEVDLNEPTLWPWVRDWRSRIPREAPYWSDPR